MANSKVYNSTDAAGIAPKLVPNANLMARDDSGGPEYDPYTQQFGDGGYVQGEKPHLTATGSGTADTLEGSEVSDKPRTARYDAISGIKHFGKTGSAAKAKE